MNSMLKDVRYALRSLLKRPSFTLVSVITLALGIGANTAIFTVLNALLLRPLPVKDPEQLVFLSNPDRHGVNGGQETGTRFLFAFHEFEWLRDHNQVFSEVFAVQSALSTQPVFIDADQGGEAERARISAVSGGYFPGLGVNTIRGRPFSAEVDKPSASNPVAVISYDYWKHQFALDPAIIGRRSWFYTPYFHVSRHPNFSWAINEVRTFGNPAAVATAIRAVVKDTSPLIDPPEIHNLNELVGQTITTERMIMTLCSFFGLLAVFLACIGLYGVMSYNVAGRTNEIGIRTALGAQRSNLFRLIAGQGMTLVLLGLLIGLGAAFALTRLIGSLLFEVSPTDSITFLGVAMLLVTVALLACFIPARRATKVDPLVALRYE